MKSGAWSRVVKGAVVAAVVMTARSASAQVSDVVWSALKERDIIVEKQDGSSVGGKLIGVDAASIVLMQPDGRPLQVDRSTVQSAQVRTREAQPAPSDSAAPPPPGRKRAAIGQQVIVVTEEEEIAGKLVDVDDNVTVIEKDRGERVTVPRASIQSVRTRFPRAPALPSPSAAERPPEGDKIKDGEPTASAGAVPAQHGLQMTVETGYAIPFGSADGSLSQSDFVSGQLPLIFTVGLKLGHFFFGVYGGVGFGGAGGVLSDVCSAGDVSCSSLTWRLGPEVHYHFLPSARFNPYIGYGIGLETTSIRTSAGGMSSSFSALGPEFARLMFGVDYRLSRIVGFGPYINLSVGQYASIAESMGGASQSARVRDKEMHGSFAFGARFVLFP